MYNIKITRCLIQIMKRILYLCKKWFIQKCFPLNIYRITRTFFLRFLTSLIMISHTCTVVKNGGFFFEQERLLYCQILNETRN